MTNKVNYSNLINQTVAESLIQQYYSKSKVQFLHTTHNESFALVNGYRKLIKINRNSSKYLNSSNFIVTIDKNKICTFNNAIFVFIDDVTRQVYIVSGLKLLSYIVNHGDDLQESKTSINKFWIAIPKQIIADTASENNCAIPYNTEVSNILNSNINYV